jgi:uncharacterized membrane protein HdeD (DUF308 family)
MSQTGLAAHSPAFGTSPWKAALLGAFFIVAGLFVLANVAAATVISAIVFGLALMAAGAFEIFHSFWAPHWGGVFFRLLVGLLYLIAGVILIADPLAASVAMTLVFAGLLIASGVVRFALAFKYWERAGWLLLASGLIGILAGLMILAKWPLSGLWVFGLVVGIDLVVHGVWWAASGWIAWEPRTAPR